MDILTLPGMVVFWGLTTSLPFSNNCLTNAVNCSHSIKKSKTPMSPENLEKKLAILEKKVTASIERRQWRKQNLPGISFDTNLPITARQNDIIEHYFRAAGSQ